jgi:UDPglucose 6-dehydrogenase
MDSICCIGLGRLGLLFANILAKYSTKVYGFDINNEVQNIIKYNKKSLEPKLNYLIKKNKNKFFFEKNFTKIISETSSAFIIVPTPSMKNHAFDNKYILSSLDKICEQLQHKSKYVINITSTVNPGSCNFFINYIEKKYNLKHGKQFVLTYNPHLIALGSIYENVLNPDLVIIGSDLKYGHRYLNKLYSKIYKKKVDRVKFLNLKEAEISKIAINTFITLKISYANTISHITDNEKKINSAKILEAIGTDSRIGKKYLSLGALFSGPCFPRDNLSFVNYLKKKKVLTDIPLATEKINNFQIKRYIKCFNNNKKFLNKKKITIGICGLSYKNNTDLNTSSPGILLKNYFKKKYKVIIHDLYKNYIDKKINFYPNINNFFNKSDVIFLCYKNNNFKKIENFSSNKNKLIIDLWNFIKIKKKNIILKKIGIS